MTEADWAKAIVSVITTALGVLLGLLGNTYVNWRRETRAYKSMLRAIASEGKSNKVILDESFLKYYANGIVLRQFSAATATRCVSDPLFTKSAKPTQLEVIYDYLRNISLANAYREKNESLQLDRHDKCAKVWMDSIVEMWKNNLEQCKMSIEKVVAIADEESHGATQPGAAKRVRTVRKEKMQ